LRAVDDARNDNPVAAGKSGIVAARNTLAGFDFVGENLQLSISTAA
jgi:hypothetical protein